MIIRKKEVKISLTDRYLEELLNRSLSSSIPLDRFLWFDIETTGLSAKRCPVYLIGCIRRENGRFIRYQLMTRSVQDEPDVLSFFLTLCREAECLVEFNGDTFDIPYIEERCRVCSLPGLPKTIVRLDLLKQIRPWRRLLGLSGCRQKDLERYLGLFREDQYDGGELIRIYSRFEQLGLDDLYDLLILHNENDMDGMMELCRLLAVPVFFNGYFSLISQTASGSDPETPRELTLSCASEEKVFLPRTVAVLSDSRTLRAQNDRLTLRLPIYHGTFKYFYPNYRDYVFLPEEDCAIHKSVGEFVDKNHRVNATASTCYTKKTGLFLSQPSVIFTPAFYETYKGKSSFFLYEKNCFSDEEKLNAYIRTIIDAVKSGKG